MKVMKKASDGDGRSPHWNHCLICNGAKVNCIMKSFTKLQEFFKSEIASSFGSCRRLSGLRRAMSTTLAGS
jgi:superoxide dismutase